MKNIEKKGGIALFPSMFFFLLFFFLVYKKRPSILNTAEIVVCELFLETVQKLPPDNGNLSVKLATGLCLQTIT